MGEYRAEASMAASFRRWRRGFERLKRVRVTTRSMMQWKYRSTLQHVLKVCGRGVHIVADVFKAVLCTIRNFSCVQHVWLLAAKFMYLAGICS